jgi:vacuolar-type H+-ATPase subunit I/STV1
MKGSSSSFSCADMYRAKHMITTNYEFQLQRITTTLLGHFLPEKQQQEYLLTLLNLEEVLQNVLMVDLAETLRASWSLYYPLGEPLHDEEIEEAQSAFYEWYLSTGRSDHLVSLSLFCQWYRDFCEKIVTIRSRENNYDKNYNKKKEKNVVYFFKEGEEEEEKEESAFSTKYCSLSEEKSEEMFGLELYEAKATTSKRGEREEKKGEEEDEDEDSNDDFSVYMNEN